MVKNPIIHEEKDYYLFPKKRSDVGHYSGEPRDYRWEDAQKEPDYDDPEAWLKLKRKDPKFIEETEELWKTWTDKDEGLNPKEVNVYWTGQSHLDLAWEWRMGQTVEKSRVTYQKAVFHAKNIPEYIFAASQPLTLEFVRQKYPELFEEIVEQNKKNKFELVGGLWTEIDARMPCGESFVRNRLYGQLYYLKYFGKIASVEWLPDTFGYAYSMPQIIKKSGGRYFFTTKVWGHGKNYPDAPWPFVNFWWQGPDGSKVLAHIQPQMFGPIPEWPNTKRLSRLVKEGHKYVANYLTDHPENHPLLSDNPEDYIRDLGVFFGLGDGGHGPTGKEVAQQDYFMKVKGVGKWSTIHEYFNLLEQKYGERLPIWDDELYFQAHHGTLTTQGLVKRGNRLLEWKIIGLEMLYTLAEMLGLLEMPYADFTQVWKFILTNQFHDILPGSSIAEVYDDTWDFYNECYEKLNELESYFLEKAFPNLGLPEFDSEKVISSCIVANPMGFGRKSVVKIEADKSAKTGAKSIVLWLEGEFKKFPIQFVSGDDTLYGVDEPIMLQKDRLEFVADLKPFQVVPGWITSEPVKENANVPVIKENGDYIEMDNGRIKIIIDKNNARIRKAIWNDGETSRQIFKEDAFILRAFGDFEGGDAWEISPNFRENPMDWEIVKNPEIVEEGPVRVAVEMRFKIEDGDSEYIYKIILYRELAEIHTELIVDMKDPYFLIKAFYPTTTSSEITIAEIPAAVISRKTHPTASHDIPRWEVFHHTFVDMPTPDNSWGIAFINEGKYGYCAVDDGIEITLLRKPRYPKIADEAWVLPKRRERIKRGEYIPGTTDEHWHVIRQVIHPHRGDWESANLVNVAHAFNSPVISHLINKIPNGPSSDRKFPKWRILMGVKIPPIDVSPAQLEIMALKPHEPTAIAHFDAFAKGEEEWSSQYKGGGYILRVVNMSASKISGEIKLTPRFEINEIKELSLLELPLEDDAIEESAKIEFDSDGSTIRTEWKPFEIRTFLLF